MKYFKILPLILIVFSCQMQNDNKVKEILTFYENGSVKSKGYEEDGKPVDCYYEYYSNGKVKVEAYYLNGLQDSIQKVFFEDGSLYQIMSFKLGLLQGNVKVYNKSGKLSEIQEYITVGDSSVLNQFYSFDSIGEIDIFKSHFLSLFCSTDTIIFGETYELVIKLEGSQYDMNMLAIIGEYNETYQQINSTANDTLWDRNDGNNDMSVTYKINEYRLGSNTIRGVIWDYVTYYDSDSSKISRDIHKLYFSKDFFSR